jgi:lysophospholipase L1-like esterase
VLVLSIPDWGVTPFARNDKRDAATIASEIDAFNAAAQKSARRKAWPSSTSRRSRANAAAPEMLAEDGLHPSAPMYTLWTQAALPVARGLLAK